MSFKERFNPGKSPLHPLTLSFKDKEINRLYAADAVCKALSLARLSLLLGVVIFIFFSFLDPYILSSEGQVQVMQLRIIAISLFLLTVGLTYTKLVKKYYQLIMITILLLGGGIVLLMIIAAEPSGGNYYYASIILATIYAHSLLRLRFIIATAGTWFIIAIYEFIAYNVISMPEGVFFSNSLFIISANCLGMFASYGIEYYMRISFLRNLMLHEKSILLENEYKRKSRELEEAREIQLSMIPKMIPDHPLYDISYSMKTASEVGGDFFDLIVSDDGTITFAVGDATGHGAKAGAMVTAMKFLFSNYGEKCDLVQFLEKADHSIRQMRLPRLYMSFLIGRIKGDIIEVAGVGMPAITMYNHAFSKVCKLNLKGFPLGSTNPFPYKMHSSVISDNDTLMIVTDGLPELFNRDHENFGYEKLEKEFLKRTSLKAGEIVNGLISAADEWKEDYPQNDDITLVIIKKKELVKTETRILKRDFENKKIKPAMQNAF